MSAGMSMAGLRPEQGPPLAIPVSFFLTAPLAVIAAGVLLMSGGSSLLWTRFAGATAALVHLGVLGLLGSVMLGALYQLVPVVAGSPVPAVRVAHGVHAGLVIGVAALVWGFVAERRVGLVVGASVLSLVLATFLVGIGIALARAPARGPTVNGMRVAVAGLGLVAVLGVLMAHLRGSGAPSLGPARWLAAHLTTGLVVWIGGLIAAVSFQVVPMFYLTPPFPRWVEHVLVALSGLTLAAVAGMLLVGASPQVIAAAGLPGAAAAWGLHPVVALWAVARRRRKRPDASLAFWRAGLCCALLGLPTGALALYADDTRWPVLFGWLMLWGWAAMIVHGMLGRIVPFLVWFHRFSKRAGLEPVPSMRQLLPEAFPRAGFALHLATLLAGVAALATGASVLARVTGIGLVMTGAALFASVTRVVLHGRQRTTTAG